MSFVNVTAQLLACGAEGDARYLRFGAAEIAAAARPFQFVLVRVPDEGFVLRRPLSVCDAREGEIDLLVKPVGAGSARLCALAPGDACEISGPFGRAPALPAEDPLFVAGGIGVAGVFFAVAEAARRGARPRLLFGARTAGQLYAADRLQSLGAELTLVTDDGSRGLKGTAAEHLPSSPPAAVVACGPRAIYRALRERIHTVSVYEKVLDNDDEYTSPKLFILMEEHMACGVGACRSCVVPAREPAGSYIAVCREGPLVDAAVLDWDRMEEKP